MDIYIKISKNPKLYSKNIFFKSGNNCASAKFTNSNTNSKN